MIKLENPHVLLQKAKVYGKSSNVTNNVLPTAGKKVLVVVEKNPEELSAEEREQLEKILGACKLQTNDYAIVADYSNRLRTQGSYTSVIIFGDADISGNMQLPRWQLVELDGLRIIKAEPLAKLLKNDKGKKVLWTELKKMFAI